MHQQGAHKPRIAKTHFGLGRMHIDVELAWVERDEQRDQRMTIARQIVGISGAHSAEQKLVAHRAAVDEKILAERIGARERRQCRKALHVHAFALGGDLDCVGAEVGAKHVAEPGEAAGGARQRSRECHRRALLAGEREGHIRPAHGEPAHDLAHGLRLGAVELEELQSRGRGIEQVTHLDPRPLTERRGL